MALVCHAPGVLCHVTPHRWSDRRDRQRLFAATCWHGLVPEGAAWWIAWKRVHLVNCDGELDGLVILF